MSVCIEGFPHTNRKFSSLVCRFKQDIFAVHDTILEFIKSLSRAKDVLRKAIIIVLKHENFIIENQVPSQMNVLSEISSELTMLKIIFEYYFGEAMKRFLGHNGYHYIVFVIQWNKIKLKNCFVFNEYDTTKSLAPPENEISLK